MTDKIDNKKHINDVYRLLLDNLSLSEPHRQSLYNRGFGDKEIKQFGYKSIPRLTKPIVEKISKQIDLSSVPGFYKNEKSEWQMVSLSGLAIPVLDIANNIVAVKIRVDNTEGQGKYIQLSSNPNKKESNGQSKYSHGAKASIAVHHPNIECDKSVIRITEGELKADLATSLSGIYTLSIPGITMWGWVMDSIDIIDPKKILLSFDSDKNKQYSTSVSPDAGAGAVGKCLSKLYLKLKNEGYNVFIEDWQDEYGKGIDDVLSQGFDDQIKIMSNKEASEFCESSLSDERPIDWVYVIAIKRFVNWQTYRELDKEQMADFVSHEMKIDKACKKLLNDPSFPKYIAPTYEPNKPMNVVIDGFKYLNWWKPSDVVPVDDDQPIAPFLDHLRMLIPDQEERDHVLNYLSYIVQNPGKKIHWCVIIQSQEGVGKGYIGHVMRKCLGEHNVNTPSNNELHENYSSWQKNCQLVIVNELMARGRVDLMNKLKDMITEDKIVVREMYRPTYEIPNRYNFLMFTNHKDSIVIDRKDRRYCVIHSPSKPQDSDYYKKLFDWTNSDDNYGRILNYLMKRDLSEFKPHGHAPMTVGKEELIQNSKIPVQQWLEECIESKEWPLCSDVVSPKHLADKIPSYLNKVSPATLSNKLKDCGAVLYPRPVELSDGTRHYFFVIRNFDDWVDDDDSNEVKDRKLRNHYEDSPSSKGIPGHIKNPLDESQPL